VVIGVSTVRVESAERPAEAEEEASFSSRRPLDYVPGILLLIAVGVLGKYAQIWWNTLARHQHWTVPDIEYVLWAILIGLLITNTIGLHRVFRPGVLTYEFWLKVGIVALGSRFVLGDIAKLGGKRLTANGEALGFDPETQADYDRVVRDITKLSDQIPLDAPWTMPRAEEYDHITTDAWLTSQTRNNTVLEFLRAYVRGIFTADSYQISFLFFLFYMRSGDNYDMLFGYENAAQAWTVKETMHQVAVHIASELGNAVVLQTPVRGITQAGAAAASPTN